MKFSINKKYYISPLIKYILIEEINSIKFIFCDNNEQIVIINNWLISFFDNFDNKITLKQNLENNWIKITKEILKNLIYLFSKKIFIDDINKNYCYDLSYREIEYYRNNIIHFYNKYWKNGFELQSKLKKKKIAIIWLWGTATALISHFIGLWLSEIRLIDYDRVEVTNLQRQYLYTLKDVWKKKTKVMQKIIEQRNPFTKVSILDLKIDWKKENLDKLSSFVEDVDLVINAADEWGNKFFFDIQRIFFELKLPFCNWAFWRWLILPLVIPWKSSCYECFYNTYSFLNEDFFWFNPNSVTYFLLSERNAYIAREIIKFLLFNDCELINCVYLSENPYQRKTLEINMSCSFCNVK